MKQIMQIVAAITVIVSMTGCTSSKPYFIDRGRDAADIFTVTFGYGIGGKARIGPVQVGLLTEQDRVGLRGGVFSPKILGSTQAGFLVCDTQLGLIGWEDFVLVGQEDISLPKRHKNYDSSNIAFVSIFNARPYNTTWRLMPYHTEIQVVCGCLWCIRLGFNPGELIDFLLGWTGMDIYDDDIEAKKETEKSNQVPEDTARKLADPQH